MLARTDFPRTTPTREAKVRMRKCACKLCRKPFAPSRPLQSCCSPFCAIEHAVTQRLQKTRKERQEGLAKLKRRADWLKEAQTAFNAYIRERDKALPCVCCGRTNVKDYLTAGAWHAGHYRSIGSAPHMRFHEDNVHRQLAYCNDYKSGRAVDYRIGLIARIGLERVEALERDDTPRKWSIPELQEIKKLYRQKLKDLQEKSCN